MSGKTFIGVTSDGLKRVSGNWVFEHLTEDADSEYAMIDSVIVPIYTSLAQKEDQSVGVYRMQQRRADHGNRCFLRCFGQSD